MDFQKEIVAEYDRETAKTRKMLEAIAADVDFNYKPHPKSMTLGHLAGHLTDMTGNWALETLTKDKMDLPADHKWEQYIPASKKELLEKFDSGLPAVRAALAAVSPEKWDEHHRAQLGVYLRLLGKPIPGMYGPSADEM
jgi:uncharacterized damage-inducible protein DinB